MDPVQTDWWDTDAIERRKRMFGAAGRLIGAVAPGSGSGPVRAMGPTMGYINQAGGFLKNRLKAMTTPGYGS